MQNMLYYTEIQIIVEYFVIGLKIIMVYFLAN